LPVAIILSIIPCRNSASGDTFSTSIFRTLPSRHPNLISESYFSMSDMTEFDHVARGK
jgi:hypothetical protein